VKPAFFKSFALAPEVKTRRFAYYDDWGVFVFLQDVFDFSFILVAGMFNAPVNCGQR